MNPAPKQLARIQDGTALAATTESSRRPHVGRSPSRRRPQTRARAAEDRPRLTRTPQGALPRVDDPSSCRQRPLPSFSLGLRCHSGCYRRHPRHDLSRPSLLGATGPRSRNCRSRQPRRPHERHSRPRHSDRSGGQTRRGGWKGLGRSVSRARADDAARSSACDRLCSPQLQKASSGECGHRSPQFGPLVRRLEATTARARRSESDVRRSNLARCDRLASPRSHRPS